MVVPFWAARGFTVEAGVVAALAASDMPPEPAAGALHERRLSRAICKTIYREYMSFYWNVSCRPVVLEREDITV
jgi:beta-glucosidase-like glycosyl hydrolase